MELLDAVIALAVTLAALATTVTVLMEVCIRTLGLKTRTQLQLFRTIFDDAVRVQFGQEKGQHKFLNLVLANPLVIKQQPAEPATDETSTAEANAPATSADEDETPPWAAKYPNLAGFVGLFRKRVSAESPIPLEDKPFAFFGSRDKGIYEWVSQEHVLRRLLRMPGVINLDEDVLVAKLRAFAHKYDELCAAASAEFKDSRRRWSVIAGLLLALVVNADGVRIFDEFVKNPALAATMAAKLDQFENAAEAAEARLSSAEAGEQAGDLETLTARIRDLRTDIQELESVGLPIGWSYWPHCTLVSANDSKRMSPSDWWVYTFGTDSQRKGLEGRRQSTDDHACITAGEAATSVLSMDGIGALLVLVGTGLLIGLGAPFWFDVAKRLAEVRSFLGGKGGGGAAYDGENANPRMAAEARAEATVKLIERVVKDERTQQRVSDKSSGSQADA